MARILLVEDHDLVHRHLCEAIEAAGHTAHCVKTKSEGEAALSSENVDLVICDVRLPDGSGHALAERAAELGIKVVLMSGHPEEAAALAIAGVRHLQKPFRIGDLMEFVRQNLGA